MKIYAKINNSEQTIDETSNPVCPYDYIEMQYERPDVCHIAQSDGSWSYSQALFIQSVLNQRNLLASEAAQKIAPLQDAVDIDEATDEEIAKLKAWKKYRVLLNRIEQQEGFPNKIEWPEKPKQ